MPDAMPQWVPDPARVAASHLARFLAARRAEGVALPPTVDGEAYRALHAWSIADPAEFWSAVWRDGRVIADVRADGTAWDEVVVGVERMAPPDPVLGPHWFPGARLNFAENLLRHDGDADALIAWDERGAVSRWSWRTLRETVARLTAGLAALGVGQGDRVAGWLPNMPETIAAMLATSALGAVWTSCSPDFGVEGIVDRFGQTAPRVLFFCDGYGYGGKVHDCVARAEELLPRLPSVEHAVMIPYRGARNPPGRSADAVVAIVARRRTAPTARLHPPPVRSSALHPLFVGHHRAAEVHGARGRAGRCCSTSRSTVSTATCTTASGSSTSPPAAG
ncbi:MAG: AMP-binding protein [Gemmatimonadales bacterium]